MLPDFDDQAAMAAMDVSSVIGQSFGPVEVSYNARDLMLYALGLGCRREAELCYLYEQHPQFQAFPTYLLTLPSKGTSSDAVAFPGEVQQWHRNG